MGFLDIGLGEILLVLIVALMIWGPGRMVEIARMLGKLMHTLRKATSDLTATVTKEIDEGKDNSPRRQSSSTKGTRQVKTPEK